MAWTIVLLGMSANVVVGQENLPRLLATRQAVFSIPFRLDPGATGEQAPRTVQLLVSVDRGGNWRSYGETEPEKGSFLFRAGGDGEYWFLIRTVDRRGQMRPRELDRPGLRVVVDTVPPSLQLNARRGDAGEIVLRWQASDPNLQASSLTLMYRTEPTQPWQSVAIDRPTENADGPSASGSVSWWPPAGAQRVEIRGEVTDTAGNHAVNQAQVTLIAVPTSTLPPPPLNSPPNSPLNTSAGRLPPPPSTGEGSVAIQIHPAVRDQFVPSRESMLTNRPADLPAGERPRMVNSRRFAMEYDIRSINASGPVQMELWGTRNNGRTWNCFGRDNEKRSPMLVTVPEEGLYGFRLSVRTGSGPSYPPPPDALPEMWVGVDLTKPICRIVGAEPASADQPGRLMIRWEADDQQLATRPISLSFGNQAGGPWTSIAAGLENSGQYTWTMDDRVSERVYLRLEARDEAGNLGIFETCEPILMDRRRPAVRILNVRPLSPTELASEPKR